MVVVDTSVWIDLLQGHETPQSVLLKRLPLEEEVCIPDLCLLEVLRGSKSDEHLEKTYEHLRSHTIVSIGGESMALAAARNARGLRTHGVQAQLVDCLIATYCVEQGLRLLTSDKGFDQIAEWLPLSLVR